MLTKLTLSVTENERKIIKQVSKRKLKPVSKLVVDYFIAMDKSDRMKDGLLKQLNEYAGILKDSDLKKDKQIKDARYNYLLKKHVKA